jgi:proteasome lid subunit RPN8/RPN11
MTKVRVEITCQVLREIRRHARSSMDAEICGVLIGSVTGARTVVSAAIPGEDARQGGSHVTFTQDTWAHIYKVKDARYPDERIVGWYHSHPGFGIFLSDQDTFIHQNFFSSPGQIAWVYDPHTDEEGCFAWEAGEIERLTEVTLRDEPGEASAAPAHAIPVGETGEPARKSRMWAWVGFTISHILVLLAGFLLGALMAPRVIIVPERALLRDGRTLTPSPAATPEEARKK